MITIDGTNLSTAELLRIANGEKVQLSAVASQKMDKNHGSIPTNIDILSQKRRWMLGESANASEFSTQDFILAHCAGVGELLSDQVVRAAMAARCNVLAQGHSGCRSVVAEALIHDLNANILAKVPSQGSVGAAGDLAPMAHIARTLCGLDGIERDRTPLTPEPKEALALINGVSMSTAIAALTIEKAWTIFEAFIWATAGSMEVILAQSQCIDPSVLAIRGFPEPAEIGAVLRQILVDSKRVQSNRRPDAFSIRSGPSVIGTALRSLRQTHHVIYEELNGCSDNPLCINGQWLEAGHFHGAAISTAMDQLRVSLAQLGSLSERRTFRLTHGQLSEALPSFLIEGTGLNSGFMLAQYTAAALSSEMKGLAHPASVDSIPTVQHHEDHVSMAPIAARLTSESTTCLADIVAIELLLMAQGLDLRQQQDHKPHPVALSKIHAAIRTDVPFWSDDHVLHPCISKIHKHIRCQTFSWPIPRLFPNQ